LIILAIAVLRLWVVEMAYVEGGSMNDTLQQGDRVLILKLLEPKRFDIVVFKDPEEGGVDIKRVIGLPDENVYMVPKLVGEDDQKMPVGSQVYINAKPLEEPYTTSLLPKAMAPRKLKPTRYFLLGDNRDVSVDSRDYWGIERKDIRGVAIAVVYPISRVRLLRGSEAAGAR
jgi:signal peptidase I